jgi:hypothetical protein
VYGEKMLIEKRKYEINKLLKIKACNGEQERRDGRRQMELIGNQISFASIFILKLLAMAQQTI